MITRFRMDQNRQAMPQLSLVETFPIHGQRIIAMCGIAFVFHGPSVAT